MRELDAEAGVVSRGSLLPRLALLAVTVAAVVGSGWWWVRATVVDRTAVAGEEVAIPALRAAGDADASVHSLAVLRFESFSASGGEDYFALGMQEALTSRLSQLGFLRVVSRTTIMQYDASGKSVPTIGEEMGVDAVVEGSVLGADGRVRITVQLIHAATDRHLWAADYERDLVDVIALQREVAQSIASEIRGELAPSEGTGLPVAIGPGTRTDSMATDEVLRGRMALSRDEEGWLDSAAVHFARAVGQDSSFVPGFLGMAQVHLMRGLAGDALPDTAEIRAATEMATHALSLDPSSREAQEILGHIGSLGGGAVPQPGRLAPPFPLGARGLDSMQVVVFGEGRFDWMPALTEAGRQLQVAVARREAGQASTEGRLRAARRLTASGLHEQARELLEELLDEELEARKSAGEDVPPMEEARAHAALRRTETALDLLEQAVSVGDPAAPLVRGDPVWDDYRREPRFLAALSEMGRIRLENVRRLRGPRPNRPGG